MGGIDKEYRLAMVLDDLRSLGLAEGRQPAIGSEVRCFAIVAMMEDGSLTANLLAPIVVNSANRRGVQAIRLDSDYSHRYPVAEGLCS
jgi:flagellar assembly factor FliW